MKRSEATRRLILAGAASLPWLAHEAAAQPTPQGPPGGPPGGPGGAGGPPRRPPPPPPTAEEIAAALPLKTTGLEHVSVQIPDVATAGLFYGKVFNPFLHKEKAEPLRYYVPFKTGEVAPGEKLGYLAIGARRDRPTAIDHYCPLVVGYKAGAVNARLRELGMTPSGPVGGMFPDSDGNVLQLLGVPGGLAASTEPAGRITPDQPFVNPVGLDNVILQVADVEKAIALYQKIFNGKVTRGREVSWMQIEHTRLGFKKAPAGQKGIASFGIAVRPFDRAKVTRQLEGLGAKIVKTSGEEADTLRFVSPFEITTDIKAVKS